MDEFCIVCRRMQCDQGVALLQRELNLSLVSTSSSAGFGQEILVYVLYVVINNRSRKGFLELFI